MKQAQKRMLTAVLLAPLAAGACGGSRMSPGQPGNDTAAELEAIFNARTDSARARFTEADTRFMINMIGHHAQAIEMAQLAPTRAESPAIQTLAARIINAQRDEIATMQQWLRDRDQPVPEVHVTDGAVMVHGPGHALDMPGMVSPERLRQLRDARGAAFDRLFLTLMIEHHRGAVTMVDALFATDGAAQDDTVFKLASDVQVDQRTEVARMERMLAAMPADSRSP